MKSRKPRRKLAEDEEIIFRASIWDKKLGRRVYARERGLKAFPIIVKKNSSK